MKYWLAFLMAFTSLFSLSQPDLVVSNLYTDSLCVSGIAYYSIHFVVTNEGDEVSEYFCYELDGNEACPDTSDGTYPLNPGSNRSFSVGWLNFNNFGDPLTVELVNDEYEVNTLNNSSTIIIPDQHECPPLEIDLSVDTVLYESGCDLLGPYLEPTIFMSNHGTEDVTEFCVKFQILGQTNDTVCFTSQSYLPLAPGSTAIQQWPRIYVDGVLSLHLLHVNGGSEFWWMDFGFDENSYNNTYVEILPNISTSWCPSGCTIEEACNYDPEATLNDGSCDFESCVGCMDSAASNYDPSATINNPSMCVYDVLGCTDETAINYSPFATVDDGSCIESIVGCMIPEALNYNPLANITCVPIDECCIFPLSGCTDEAACNFTIGSNVDDGSCEYGEEGYDCDGNCLVDTDQDGVCDQFEIPGCTDLEADNYNPLATDDDGTCEYTINLAREVNDVEDLNVYPNPFDNVIYVSTLPGSLCRVRDINGRIVIERTMSAVISMNLLEGGIYFVDWILDGEVALTKKIVKR